MDRRFALFAGITGLVIAVLALVAIAPWSGHTSAQTWTMGDADCNETIDPNDALAALRLAAGLSAAGTCTATTADVDCDGEVGGFDATRILAHAADIVLAAPLGGSCPPIGSAVPTVTASPGPTEPPSETASVTVSPTLSGPPTASPSATPPEPCGGTAPMPTLPPAPGGSGSPTGGAYTTEAVLPASYLGAAGDSAIEFAVIPGRPDEAIVALQSGYIYRVSLTQAFAPQLWGDLHTRVDFGGEEGLLSVAFSPEFETDCRVYAYYTPGSPQPTILSRFEATPTDLIEGSEEVLIPVEEFAGNHNGGHIVFGNDGMLYLSLGDGGGAGDPEETGQDLARLLGKVLRIDVSGESGYTVPPGNPFADGPGGNADEVFAYGFRNPWRMTVDPPTGDVWLGDVGQGDWEEVDRVVAGGNYGWDCYEGNAEYELDGCSTNRNDYQWPRAAYGHDDGAAVTGGAVYRGDAMPELYGWYVYGDFYSGNIWAVDPDTAAEPVLLYDSDLAVASFTLAPDGELYVVTYTDGIHVLAR